MSDRPWLKFYPQDWLGDPKLRACSVAARGLWIDMISLAHEATPYGHVLVNGNAPDAAKLARMTGLGAAECESLIRELEANGVFSRTRQGVIYSRRMVKDAKRALHARKIGKLGGNPTLGKDSDILDQDNPPDNGAVKPHMPESRVQKEASSLRSDVSPARPPDDIEGAVRAYADAADKCGWAQPRTIDATRRSRIKARLREVGGLEGWREAMSIASRSPFLRGENGRKPGHEDWSPDLDFFLQPSKLTKLREGSYGGIDRPNSASTAVDEATWIQRLSAARTRRQWARSKWGPAPGEVGCLVPAHLLQPGDGVGWTDWAKANGA